MKEKIILIGGGGHCKACIDVIEQEGKYHIEGIVDVPEKLRQKILGYKIIATCAVIKQKYPTKFLDLSPLSYRCFDLSAPLIRVIRDKKEQKGVSQVSKGRPQGFVPKFPVECLPCVMQRHFIRARLFQRGEATSLGGYSGDDVGRRLRISGRGVSDCRDRGKKILDNPEIISEYLM